MTVLNPNTITITDAKVITDAITSFVVKAATVSGGPYTASQVSLPLSSLTVNAGVATGPLPPAALWTPPLSNGTYFIVAEAVNAAGVSGNSPEATFQELALPSAPTALSVA
jgi:hypothetical protein